MSDFNNGFSRVAAPGVDAAVDAGLRSFMLGVYNKLALGLVLSGAIAWVVANVAPVTLLMFRVVDGRLAGYTPLGLLVVFAPLVIMLASGFVMRRPTPGGTAAVYWAVVALLGASLGTIFFYYTASSVATTFFVTAAAFGGLSLVGYTTKKNLSAFGSFLIMALWGVIIASLVNMFLHSAALNFAVTVLGVVVFAGLIAFDTQKLKMTYYALGGDKAGMAVATNYGALSLYLDFVNLFTMLLRLTGSRR